MYVAYVADVQIRAIFKAPKHMPHACTRESIVAKMVSKNYG